MPNIVDELKRRLKKGGKLTKKDIKKIMEKNKEKYRNDNVVIKDEHR